MGAWGGQGAPEGRACMPPYVPCGRVGLTWPGLPLFFPREARNPDFYVKLLDFSMLATNLNTFKIPQGPNKTCLQAELGSQSPALAF